MKLFTTRQIAGIDDYTIEHEPVLDIDLMERAALQITNWIIRHFDAGHRFLFFAGPGNNGGDALAVARQLADLDYYCEVWLLPLGHELQGSPAINRQRLIDQGRVQLHEIRSISDFPGSHPGDVLVDGLFGSGLSRPLEGVPAAVVKEINLLSNKVIAIDIPSGLMGEDNAGGDPEHRIKADVTLTLQFPKISFLFPENEVYTGRWEVLPIGLHPEAIDQTSTSFHLTDRGTVQGMFPPRRHFAHKGDFGHALLIAGSYGKMGAAVLASRACLRSGVGLLTAHVPRSGFQILQTAVPEAMATIDPSDHWFTSFSDLKAFNAIGAGPGLGMNSDTHHALHRLIEACRVPMVLDADALNILAEHPEWMRQLPPNSILTPHPGEFRRLAGDSPDSWSRIHKQRQLAVEYQITIVLKGAHTSVALPDGTLWFNATGNPGMATAGSGDTLTGIILGLLARGFSSGQAALAGVWIHGRAGDLAANEKSEEALIAGDIADALGMAFLELNPVSYGDTI